MTTTKRTNLRHALTAAILGALILAVQPALTTVSDYSGTNGNGKHNGENNTIGGNGNHKGFG